MHIAKVDYQEAFQPCESFSHKHVFARQPPLASQVRVLGDGKVSAHNTCAVHLRTGSGTRRWGELLRGTWRSVQVVTFWKYYRTHRIDQQQC